ncbi:MAG: cupin domain-containing protein [Sodaliphilus sp.]
MTTNYSILHLNGWNHTEGKTFLADEIGMTGAQASIQKLAPGEDAPFLHSHKTHEELYVIISGSGEFQVDGHIDKVSEGSFIRVAPAGVRALRNTGNTKMIMMCIQYRANTFTEADHYMNDGHIIDQPVKW